MNSSVSYGYWAGVLSAMCIESLIQDSMGRDAFARYVQEHWTTAWVSVPVALFGLAVAVLVYCLGSRRRA
jgi:hypothetical protein